MIDINENFLFREIFNVSLLVPIKCNPISNDVIFLNETAALIFQLSKSSDNIKTLTKQVFDMLIDADENEVMPELEDYIKHLISEGFLLER